MLSEDMAEAAEREYPILDKIYEDQMVIRGVREKSGV